MDRCIIYPSSIPQSRDLLSTNLNAMVALGYLAEASVGSTSFVVGLNCIPTSPTPDLNVHVGRGMIGQMAVIDQNPYGILGADTSDPLMKMGINIATQNFPITPPATNGFSQNYLIEGQMQELDGTPVVLPYYNAANPAQPYAGPGNNNTAQNTIRTQRAALQLKAGTPAAAGSQVTPGADSGWVPLWVISVNNGQTQITSASISMAPGAPFIGTQSSQTRTQLTAPLNLYVSPTGSDSNNGLSAAVAFKTIQAAWNSILSKYDLNGQNVTVHVASGSYNANTVFSGAPVGQAGATILFIGNGDSTSLVSSGSGSCIAVQNGASVVLQNMAFSGIYGVTAFQGGVVYLQGNTDFGTCTAGQIYASGGEINILNGYNITGGAQAHYSIGFGGVILSVNAPTVNLIGTSTFSGAFALVSSGQLSLVNGGNTTFTGSATGSKFLVNLGGAINTGTGNVSYLPGSTAGSTGSGTNTGFYA